MFKSLKVLKNILFAKVTSKELPERLEQFYGGQAEGYDDTRRNFLHGRKDLVSFLSSECDLKNKVLIDVGGGTGQNLELFGDKLKDLKEVIIYDLSDSLLKIAEARIKRNGWKNVRVHKGDAEKINLSADIITFSYSLTMIPKWFLALENAYACLNPGGVLAAVDFYVSTKWPPEGQEKHSFFRRNIYPIIYSIDNVFLNKDHLPWLDANTKTLHHSEGYGGIPLVPFYKASYYVYVGQKKDRGIDAVE